MRGQRNSLAGVALSLAAAGCLCFGMIFSQYVNGGTDLKSTSSSDSDSQLLDADGMPFNWKNGDDGDIVSPSSGKHKGTDKDGYAANGVHYATRMPWAVKDHWDSGTREADTSPNSLHHRLVRSGAHDTADGVANLCNRLLSGGDSTADDPSYTAQAGTGWNPGRSAADYIMCDGVLPNQGDAGNGECHVSNYVSFCTLSHTKGTKYG